MLQQTHSAGGYDMKCVYTAHNPTEAHLVKGLLEAEGIETVVRGEHLFPLRGIIPVTADTNPSVWVVNDAEALLQRMTRASSPGRYRPSLGTVHSVEKGSKANLPPAGNAERSDRYRSI